MGLKDLSETRADRNQCASKKMEAENYAKELEEQVRMKETRKEKERREREERERKVSFFVFRYLLCFGITC